jgi:Polyketide cyclase / dehydrase and lipid transport
MSQIHVEAARVVDARPEDVYAFLSDYRTNHPRILPPEHFLDYRVEEGGKGAGTVVTFRLRAGGRERPYRMRVSEPEPGRTLVENDANSSLVTSFVVAPESGGQQSRVRITTEWAGSGGIGGFFERTFAPGAIRRIYDDELNRLASAVAPSGATAGQTSQ